MVIADILRNLEINLHLLDFFLSFIANHLTVQHKHLLLKVVQLIPVNLLVRDIFEHLFSLIKYFGRILGCNDHQLHQVTTIIVIMEHLELVHNIILGKSIFVSTVEPAHWMSKVQNSFQCKIAVLVLSLQLVLILTIYCFYFLLHIIFIKQRRNEKLCKYV